MLCMRHLSLAQVLNTTESLRPTGFTAHVPRKEKTEKMLFVFVYAHFLETSMKRCCTFSTSTDQSTVCKRTNHTLLQRPVATLNRKFCSLFLHTLWLVAIPGILRISCSSSIIYGRSARLCVFLRIFDMRGNIHVPFDCPCF